MLLHRSFVAIVAMAVAGLAALLALQSSASADDASVTIEGFAFSPASVTVNVGDTVTWSHNDGSAPHTVTSTGGGPLSSANLTQGQTYEYTFDSAGTFAYICNIHPSMTGTVTVQAQTQPTATGTATTAPSAPATGTGTAPDGSETPWAMIAAVAVAALGGTGAMAYGVVRRNQR